MKFAQSVAAIALRQTFSPDWLIAVQVATGHAPSQLAVQVTLQES